MSRDAHDFNNIETRAVIKFLFLQGKAPKEIQAILTETLACFLPGRAKDLSAPLYVGQWESIRNVMLKNNVILLSLHYSSNFPQIRIIFWMQSGHRVTQCWFLKKSYIETLIYRFLGLQKLCCCRWLCSKRTAVFFVKLVVAQCLKTFLIFYGQI